MIWEFVQKLHEMLNSLIDSKNIEDTFNDMISLTNYG